MSRGHSKAKYHLIHGSNRLTSTRSFRDQIVGTTGTSTPDTSTPDPIINGGSGTEDDALDDHEGPDGIGYEDSHDDDSVLGDHAIGYSEHSTPSLGYSEHPFDSNSESDHLRLIAAAPLSHF